jgi:hypothetical protein
VGQAAERQAGEHRGTQILDVSDPRETTSHASAVWGASEVWDAMWVPVYKNGKQTQRRTSIVYAIDLLRGLDVYAVDVTGHGAGSSMRLASSVAVPQRLGGSATPLALVGAAVVMVLGVGRLRRRPTPA